MYNYKAECALNNLGCNTRKKKNQTLEKRSKAIIRLSRDCVKSVWQKVAKF